MLTVIDYSLPRRSRAIWVLDLARRKVLFHELVAHGAGSGDVYATHFSNVNDSRSTSLGLFLTADTYEGGNGYSLKLKGLDAGVNDLAEARHIVMHGAWYVSPEHAQQYGKLGRSWGCPALPLADAKPVIDTVKGGSLRLRLCRRQRRERLPPGLDVVLRRAGRRRLDRAGVAQDLALIPFLPYLLPKADFERQGPHR